MSGVVLVTGAGGAIGARLVPKLREAGWYVRAIIRRSAAAAADEQVRGDLREADAVARATDGVSAIVHLAAITHARNPRDYELNVDATRSLLNSAPPSCRFVHVSTCAIDPAGGAYSESKARAEALVRASPLEWVVVRLAELYGTEDGEGVDDIVRRARANRRILIVGDGADEICPVHVDDAVDALVAALMSQPRKVHTVAGECTSVRRFAEDVVRVVHSRSRVAGLPVPLVRAASILARVVPLPLYPDQLARLRAPKGRDTSSAREDLSFRPRSLESGLAS
ncbi:MAG: NAD-dependent epimerase/dehydratase family protein [Gaiellaceae bacterium]